MTTCINFKKQFGDKHKIRVTPGYEKFSRDPWNFEVICKFGVIYPNGDDELGFVPYEEIKEAPVKITKNALDRATEALMISGCLIPREESSDPKNLLFRLKDFRQVAKIVKPRRKRQMNKEQRQAAIENLRKYRETQQ